MSVIHQFIFACAPRRKSDACDGESAPSSPDVSLRAASLAGRELENYLRRIEPLLPLEWTLASSEGNGESEQPPKLFFIPLDDEVQIIGQVCRATGLRPDEPPTTLAHVLLRDASDPENQPRSIAPPAAAAAEVSKTAASNETAAASTAPAPHAPPDELSPEEIRLRADFSPSALDELAEATGGSAVSASGVLSYDPTMSDTAGSGLRIGSDFAGPPGPHFPTDPTLHEPEAVSVGAAASGESSGDRTSDDGLQPSSAALREPSPVHDEADDLLGEPVAVVHPAGKTEGASRVAAAEDASPWECRWTALDGLPLWGAEGWICEEPHELWNSLPSLPSFASVLGEQPGAVDDRVFLSFLTEPESSDAFYDPAGVIPARWRAMEPQMRAEWFAELFTGVVRTNVGEAAPVLFVAEPGAVALAFYGVARLLPDGSLRGGVSVSTAEPVAARAQIRLAGLWSDSPEAIADEALEGCAVVVDTRRAPSSTAESPYAPYVTGVVSRLRDFGWDAVDAELSLLGLAKLRHTEQLESHLAAQRIVTSLLKTGAFATDAWRNTPAAVGLVREELIRRFEGAGDMKALLHAVLGGPTHLTLIDLITPDAAMPVVRRAIVCLLQELPPAKIIGLLRLSGVPDDDKVVTLARHIQNHGDFPPGCEFLWKEWAEVDGHPKRAGQVLMSRVLTRLPPKGLRKLHQAVPKRMANDFVLSLFRLHQAGRLRAASLSAVLRGMDEEAILVLLRQGGDEFLRSYPADEPVMGEKLAEQLYALPKTPVQFKERLRRILAGQHLLPNEQLQAAASAWSTCCQLISKVAGLQKPESAANAQTRISLLEAACRDMAKAADQAMLLEPLNNAMSPEQKRDALLRIAQEVLGGVPLLLKGPWENEALLERIDGQLSKHRWPVDSLKKETVVAQKEAAAKPRRLASVEAPSLSESNRFLRFAVIGLVLGTTALLVWLVWYFLAPESSPQRKLRKKAAPSPVRTLEFDQQSRAFDGWGDPCERRMTADLSTPEHRA